MRIFFLVLFAVTIPFAAHAACTSPDGLASQTRYDSAANKMYYCNNANWVEMGGGTAGFSNPATSALNMNSNKITSLGTPTAAGDAANKTYVDGKFGAQANGSWCRSNGTQVICDQTAPSVGTDKVSKSGDTMTGLLTLSGAPTNANHATTKTYVDSAIAAAGGGGCYVSIPASTNNGPTYTYATTSCITGFTEEGSYACAAGPKQYVAGAGDTSTTNGTCLVCCK